ncbi:MAG: SLC13 family permease [Neomegalonema sp.]|nr:SLC13 family permease [Neomegalonema sp.]
MTTEQWMAIAILVGALGLFAFSRVRHDVVALIVLGAVAVMGLAPAETIFAGFGHPAVITVAAVLILSAMLSRAGVVEIVADTMKPYTSNELVHILLLCGTVALLSAFINNVGALALMMPVALATAAENKRNPAILLMPLAFAAILGGMTTQIGTPPNIIIAQLRADAGLGAFGLFDFTPVGLATAVAGVAFVALIGWRLLPAERRAADPQQALFDLGGYVAELRVPEGSVAAGKALRELPLLTGEGASVLSISQGGGEGPGRPAMGFSVLLAGDVVLFRGGAEAIAEAVAEYGLEVVDEGRERALSIDEQVDWRRKGESAGLIEAVVSPRSPWIGWSARLLDRRYPGLARLMALAREGRPIRGRLRDETIQAGDVALIQGEEETLRALIERYRLLPLAERGLALGGPRRLATAALALALFAVAVLAAALGFVPTAVAFTLAVIGGALTGLIPVRELYDDIDWSVIVLLGAMFPLGIALEKTGAMALMAEALASGAGAAGVAPWMVMVLLMVVTMFVSDVINNAATALLMGGLAIKIAPALNASTDAFLMAVAVGASCAFLTPIGHQCNTLVMGPGGYRFGDYWRMGLPLELLIILVAAPMIIFVWGV